MCVCAVRSFITRRSGFKAPDMYYGSLVKSVAHLITVLRKPSHPSSIIIIDFDVKRKIIAFEFDLIINFAFNAQPI